MGGNFKREAIYVYLWLIHVEDWQKTAKFCKAIILQLKKNNKNWCLNMKIRYICLHNFSVYLTHPSEAVKTSSLTWYAICIIVILLSWLTMSTFLFFSGFVILNGFFFLLNAFDCSKNSEVHSSCRNCSRLIATFFILNALVSLD